MKRCGLWLLVFTLTAACAATPTNGPTARPPIDLTRSDAQGAVEFTVTPLNLSAQAATLEFEVVMDTHSVDLGWDLATQSTLTTDAGLAMTGSQWTVGSGHHYESTLVFPAQTAEGQVLLANAHTLTLTIHATDVPERIFVWQLNP